MNGLWPDIKFYYCFIYLLSELANVDIKLGVDAIRQKYENAMRSTTST